MQSSSFQSSLITGVIAVGGWATGEALSSQPDPVASEVGRAATMLAGDHGSDAGVHWAAVNKRPMPHDLRYKRCYTVVAITAVLGCVH